MNAREAQRLLQGDVLAELRALNLSMTALAERYAGQVVNHVLHVETATFDATGVITRQWHTAAGCIEVDNLAAAVAVASPADTHPANPAAGAEISITVPAGQTWQLQDIDFTLTTSAAAGNRQVQLIIDDGVNELWRFLVTVTQAASLAYIYAFGGATSDAAVRAATGVNEVLSEMDLPGITLGAGYRIRTSTVGIQAGDQYSAITVAYTVTSTVSHAVTVVSGGNTTASAPNAGPNIYIVPAGTKRVVALNNHQVTLYGVAGDTVSFQVFTVGPRPGVT